MNRDALYKSLLMLAGLLLLVGGFFAMFQRKSVTEPKPPTGAALFNRFFALELTLDQLHVPVTSLTTLDPRTLMLRRGDTLVLGADPARVSVGDAVRIASWVRAGGHLVLSPGTAASSVHTALFEALHLLDAKPAQYACASIDIANAEVAKEQRSTLLCGSRFYLTQAADNGVEASIGDAQTGYLFARTSLGRGEVSLLGDMQLLSNPRLRNLAAQYFSEKLLAPNMKNGRFYLVYELDGMPFLKFLGIKGWPALLALGLLLAGWMAMRSARLGPLMPAPALHRRALLEHVQAAGEFLYRRDAGRSLHQLASQTVLARLRRRDPTSAMLHGEALYARLAERSELDVAQIAQAFQSPANAQAFRACILTLARLRSRP